MISILIRMVKVAFLHPDLGIGGAERLVIDMALALLRKKHEVTIYTTHHNPTHCFSETTDGTVQVVPKFDWLPRKILGKFYALCAVMRMIFLAIFVRLCVSADVYIVDQVSMCVPFLKVFSSKKVLFYCHYPDMLLTQRNSFFKLLYRKPLDYLEGLTTSMADKILVNSLYTKRVVSETFSHVGRCEVLYPSLNTSKFENGYEIVCTDVMPRSSEFVFLSLNRYERKKNITLALEAMSYVKKHCSQFEKCHMIVAGGYDSRVTENVEHHLELEQSSQELEIHDNTTFLRSISDTTKLYLLRNCTALLYTPSNEHFGIVPVESMYCCMPVIAVNSGGPLETVEDSVTGFLCDPRPDKFGEAMMKFIEQVELKERMGKAGKRRVQDLFSFEAFTEKLHVAVMELS